MHKRGVSLVKLGVMLAVSCFCFGAVTVLVRVSHPELAQQMGGNASSGAEGRSSKEVEVVPVAPERPPDIVCPSSIDVRQSIDACHKLAREARCIVRESSTASAEEVSERRACWWNDRKLSQEKNERLIAGCELLLSAHGDEVNSEIPRSLKNLDNAQRWLGWSVNAANAGKPSLSKALLRYADRAIKRADKLIAFRFPTCSRFAVVALPRHLDAQVTGAMRVDR